MPDESSEFFDIRHFIRCAWQRKFLIVFTIAGCLALAGIFAAIKTPKYRAEVLLSEADSGKSAGGLAGIGSQFGSLAELAGVNISRGGSLEESLATLKSNTVLYEFIEANGLLKIIFYKRWDDNNNHWKLGARDRAPTQWDAAREFRRSILTVSEDAKTHLVTLMIEWKDPVKATEWANELVKITNRRLKDRAIATSTRNLEYLSQQLNSANNVDLRQAISRLIEAETKTVMLARGNDEYALKIIDPAVKPDEKYSPQVGLVLISGGMFGLFLGLGLVLLLGPKVNRRH